MLYFYCPPPDADLDVLHERGVSPEHDTLVPLYTDLDAARQAAGDGPILVVNAHVLSGTVPVEAASDRVLAARVPAAALLNAQPYYPPRPVTAAGGYVACPLGEVVALLVIFRRGVWDLPKGKLDPGEAVEACARREVREEIGIDTVQTVQPLGATQHGYVRDARYEVKTTHWFLMRTPERTFAPERHEGIERVAWARWEIARRHLGYDTLRRHMDRWATAVHTALLGTSADEA